MEVAREKITQEEISKIQEVNSKFNQAKIAIADCELQKQSILKNIDELRIEFAEHEKLLVEKYGSDAVINIQTGELTYKQE